jgi:hypothetical protein
MVLALRRHVTALAELTDDEAGEAPPVDPRRVSSAAGDDRVRQDLYRSVRRRPAASTRPRARDPPATTTSKTRKSDRVHAPE